jgi:hypothetical protein
MIIKINHQKRKLDLKSMRKRTNNNLNKKYQPPKKVKNLLKDKQEVPKDLKTQTFLQKRLVNKKLSHKILKNNLKIFLNSIKEYKKLE